MESQEKKLFAIFNSQDVLDFKTKCVKHMGLRPLKMVYCRDEVKFPKKMVNPHKKKVKRINRKAWAIIKR